MAGPVDAFLKVSIAAAAALFASASIGYYYVLYLPHRDAQLDRDRRMEAAHADLAKQADFARQAAEKRESEERQAEQRQAVQTRYRICISDVSRNYSESWADECKKASDEAKKKRADCFAKGSGKDMCDILSPVQEFSADCKLIRNRKGPERSTRAQSSAVPARESTRFAMMTDRIRVTTNDAS